jgi:hypothetical protein
MDHELGLATSRRTLDRLDENAEPALGVEVGEPAVTVGPEAAAQSEQLDAVRGFNTETPQAGEPVVFAAGERPVWSPRLR